MEALGPDLSIAVSVCLVAAVVRGAYMIWWMMHQFGLA